MSNGNLAASVFALLILYLPAQAQEVDVLERMYGSGVHAYYAGDFTTAHQDLSTVIERGTKDPRPYYFRALVHMRLGRPQEAEKDLVSGSELETQDIDGSYPVGRALERVQGSSRSQVERHRTKARLALLGRRRAQDQQKYEAIERREKEVLRRQVNVPLGDAPAVPAGAEEPVAEEPKAPTKAPAAAPADEPATTEPASDDPFAEPKAKKPAPADATEDAAPTDEPAEDAPAEPASDDPFAEPAPKTAPKAAPKAAPTKPADSDADSATEDASDDPFGEPADKPKAGAKPAEKPATPKATPADKPSADDDPFGGSGDEPAMEEDKPADGAADEKAGAAEEKPAEEKAATDDPFGDDAAADEKADDKKPAEKKPAEPAKDSDDPFGE